MQISTPKESGVLPAGLREEVARIGRSTATVAIALCEDGLYRFSTDLLYSYGGFANPIPSDSVGYPTVDAARQAGLEDLLRRWCRPFPSDPESVHRELAELRRQVEDRLRQPTLF